MRLSFFRTIVLIVGLGASGCAELAGSIPALTIDANATRWRHVSETRDDERWSFGVRVGVAGSFGEPPEATRLTRTLRLTQRSAPCRVARVCAWETRSRARALEYARAASEENHP